MLNDFEKVLITENKLKTKVKELADKISREYDGKNPLLICILKGSVLFASDLLKSLSTPCQIEFMAVSSYGASTKSSGEVKLTKDLNVPIANRDVIIIEDIVDSGNTLSYLKRVLLQRNPNSVKICTLLDKPERRKVDLEADFVGFTIPDEFVVGYGLDYAEKYRALLFIGVLKPEVYQEEV
jgi:hypoxanthine phosphoribosyltransferase